MLHCDRFGFLARAKTTTNFHTRCSLNYDHDQQTLWPGVCFIYRDIFVCVNIIHLAYARIDMEETVIAWLRRAGFQPGPGDSSLTKSSIAKFTNGSNRPFWEKLSVFCKISDEADAMKKRADEARSNGLPTAHELSVAKKRTATQCKIKAEREKYDKLLSSLQSQRVSTSCRS